MEEDAKDEAEAAGKANEELLCGVNVDDRFYYLEDLYKKSDGVQWKDKADDFYRNVFTATDKEEFWKVPTSDLDYFCCDHLGSLSLITTLADALMFYKLHSTWELTICPDPMCLFRFTNHDSLVPHLMREHLNARPFLRQNPAEEVWCEKSISSMVWKPIDVSSAFSMLSTMSLDKMGDLSSLEWTLSEDSSRSKLLTNLREGFEMLLGFQGDSIRMLSNCCLRALIVVASHYVLKHLERSSVKPLPLPFRSLFCCSPFSFRFMENESLSCFVELVRQICKLVQDEVSQSREAEVSKDGDVIWSKGEHLDAVSLQHGNDCDYFVLDPAKINLCDGDKKGLASWLFEAPRLPSIPQVPSHASKILKLLESKAAAFSECLRTLGMQCDFGSAELTSPIKLCNKGHWLSDTNHMSLLGTTFGELALNCEPHLADADHIPSPSSHSVTEPTKHRLIGSDCETMQHHLELIKLTCELKLLELQVCQYCAVDLRMFILPLLRSSLRMKLYIFLLGWGYGAEIEHLQLTARLGEIIMERSSEEDFHGKFQGEHDSGDSRDVTTPYLGTCKLSEESSLTLEISGNTANSVSEIDPMMMDFGEAPGAEPPCTNQEVGIDNRELHVTGADTTLSRSITSIATTIAESQAEPEAIHESDSVPEGKTETESQWLQVGYYHTLAFETSSESDTISESCDETASSNETETRCPEMEYDWFVREKRVWGTKSNGLFFRIKISDVVKHCLEESHLLAAQRIWEWKSNRTLQYWYCFYCQEKFPDQVSHMVHMESVHQLGLSCNYYCLVPSQVWQGDLSGESTDVKERTHTLDDSIEVDKTSSVFLVDMAKIRISFPIEDQDEFLVERYNLFVEKEGAIRQQLRLLGRQIDFKSKLCCSSQVPELDTEIAQNFAQLEKLKQELSMLCVFDYKDQILQSIQDFLQDKILVKDYHELSSWACKTLKDLLGFTRCSYLPDSFSTVLESTDKEKVIVNIENAEISFAYTGLSWRFVGELPFKRKRIIDGSFIFSRVSWGGGGSFMYDGKVILHECNLTSKMLRFRNTVRRVFEFYVEKKLKQFEADFSRMLRGPSLCNLSWSK